MRCSLCALVGASAFSFLLTSSAAGDPIDGRDVLKFSQKPMINTTIVGGGAIGVFHGHDELSTAWGVPGATGAPPLVYQGTFMADDFADHFSSPVVHVKWWGSYLNRPTSLPDPRVRQFLISFEEDVPVGPNNPLPFSHPGDPLLNQIVSLDADGVFKPGEGTFTEAVIPGSTSVDGPIFEYNAELHLDKAFFQKAETVYWLKIVALDEIANPNVPLPARLQWGWHNRDYTIMDPLASTPASGVVPGEHIQGFLPAAGGDIPIWHFQDDSVSGSLAVIIDPSMPIMPRVEQTGYVPQRYQPSDGPENLIVQYSKDLAFELYTVPEPATCALMGLAMVGIFGLHRQRN
jgi:hypothetical protein